MRPVAGRHIFLAHAHEDRALGQAVERLLQGSFFPLCSVFRSSSDDAISLNQGIRDAIAMSHKEATVVIALLTPHSFHRPWVMFEAGGCYFQLGDDRKGPAKQLFVVLANGLPPSALPGPLHGRNAGSLTSRHVVRLLLKQVADALGCRCRADNSAVAAVAKHAAATGRGWDSVGQALVTSRIDDSPFENIALLKRAKSTFFLAGMNLWHFTSSEQSSGSRRALFDFLRRNQSPRPRARLLLCDPRSTTAILTWADMVSADFPRHLCESLSTLKKWLQAAKKQKLALDVRVTGFVPLSLALVDATDAARGLLVITPVVNKPSRKERPAFVVTKRFNQSVFNYYHTAYVTLFEERKSSLIPSVTSA